MNLRHDAIAVPAGARSGPLADTGTGVPFSRSLRAKGLLAMLAMLAYVGASVWYVSLERAAILETVGAWQRVAQHEKALALTEAAIGTALIDVVQAGGAAATEPVQLSELAIYMESCKRLFEALEPFDAAYAGLYRTLERSYQALAAAPAKANWIDLREAMARVAADLDIRHQAVKQRGEVLTTEYQRHYDAVTVESIGLALVGLTAFGTLVAWFFAGLTRDIRRLEHHARAIVRGARGLALRTSRRDELGSLMLAVNRMADDLDAREKAIELDHQRRSHVDKMSAVGALAAGVAHEVNNPLAVIAGIAQAMRATPQTSPEELAAQASDILSLSHRAALAARHLAEVAQPPPAALDWVDVNGIVTRTLDLMRFDKRYRAVQLSTALSSEVPSIRTSGEVVQHALMRLLALACDAALAHGAAPRMVNVATRSSGDGTAVDIALAFDGALDLADDHVQQTLLFTRAMIAGMSARLVIDSQSEAVARLQLSLPSLAEQPATGAAASALPASSAAAP